MWDKVVSVIQVAFWEGYILGVLVCTTMFLIPNGSREYRGIGLVENISKVCTTIINIWFRSSIVLHDGLQNFTQGRGTGTAIMEAKLEQQLAGIVHDPLSQVFLDVREALN